MSRTIEDVHADLATLKTEMDVAMAEANLASAKSRQNQGEDVQDEADLDAALRRLGELDGKREVLQQEARSLWTDAHGG